MALRLSGYLQSYNPIDHSMQKCSFFWLWHEIQSAMKRLSCGVLRFSKRVSDEISSYVSQLQRLQHSGCSWHGISLLVFTMAVVVIIRASKWVVGGERLESGQHLTSIGAYMNDMALPQYDVPKCRAMRKVKPEKSKNV